MLVFSLSPPFAAIISWFTLGETMSAKAIFAMMVTLSGIVLVVTKKRNTMIKKMAKRTIYNSRSP